MTCFFLLFPIAPSLAIRSFYSIEFNGIYLIASFFFYFFSSLHYIHWPYGKNHAKITNWSWKYTKEIHRPCRTFYLLLLLSSKRCRQMRMHGEWKKDDIDRIIKIKSILLCSVCVLCMGFKTAVSIVFMHRTLKFIYFLFICSEVIDCSQRFKRQPLFHLSVGNNTNKEMDK